MTNLPPRYDAYGAIDLSRLAAPAAPAPSADGAAHAGAFVIDVTEETFEAEVLLRSQTVPVLVDMWAEWCGPCKQLSPILERLAAADAGRWLLAKVDVDTNQQLAAAFSVQSIPAVFAVIGGQAMPLFQGAVPEADARQIIDEVLRLAEANGIVGRLAAPAGDVDGGSDPGADAAPAAAAPPDPLDDALAALRAGDLPGAEQAFRTVLDASPADQTARAGLARVQLLRRIDGVASEAAYAAATAGPTDLAAQELAADIELAEGRPADAFTRLIALIRGAAPDDRDRLRGHLLSLFEVLGPGDPAVAAARTALANALF